MEGFFDRLYAHKVAGPSVLLVLSLLCASISVPLVSAVIGDRSLAQVVAIVVTGALMLRKNPSVVTSILCTYVTFVLMDHVIGPWIDVPPPACSHYARFLQGITVGLLQGSLSNSLRFGRLLFLGLRPQESQAQ